MKCSRPRCERIGVHLGLCNPHRELLVSQGEIGRTSTRRVLAHMAKLHALKWPNTAISEASGVSRSTLKCLPRQAFILRATERAILGLPLVEYLSPKDMMPSVGLRRRHEALAWMGWPLKETAGRAGKSIQSFCTAVSKEWVSRAYWLSYVAVYEELKDVPGPNARVRTKARLLGWAPPAAWNDGAIDNPKARPVGVRRAA